MGYSNKRGIAIGWIVMLVVALISGIVAIVMFSGIADVIKENADFQCLVGIRLASIAGSQTSPCKTSLAVITPMEFKKDREGNLNFDFKKCPQVKAQAEEGTVKELSRACETVKLADKGLTCWTNYMSGKGNLPTWTCFSVCLKPSYGSILLDESEQTIKLPHKLFNFEKPELDNFYIFPGKNFKSNKLQDMSKLEPYIGNSFGVELEKVDDSIIKLKEGSRYNDVSLVFKLPFEAVSPTALTDVFVNGKTTRGFSQGETYESRISTGRIRINDRPLSKPYSIIPISGEPTPETLEDFEFESPDSLTELERDYFKRFYFTENRDWIVQYVDSDDKVSLFGYEAADINRNLDWDNKKDSINYGYNGVC